MSFPEALTNGPNEEIVRLEQDMVSGMKRPLTSLPQFMFVDEKTYHGAQVKFIPVLVGAGLRSAGLGSCIKAIQHLKEYRRLGGTSL